MLTEHCNFQEYRDRACAMQEFYFCHHFNMITLGVPTLTETVFQRRKRKPYYSSTPVFFFFQ